MSLALPANSYASDTVPPKNHLMQGEHDAEQEVTPGAAALDARVLKRRQSNMDRRALLGHEKFKADRAAARKAQRATKKGAAAGSTSGTAEDDGVGSTPLPSAVAVPLPIAAAPVVNIVEQLERLAALKAKGDIDEDEFKAAKAVILAPPVPSLPPDTPPPQSDPPPPPQSRPPPPAQPPPAQPQPQLRQLPPTVSEAAEHLVSVWRYSRYGNFYGNLPVSNLPVITGNYHTPF